VRFRAADASFQTRTTVDLEETPVEQVVIVDLPVAEAPLVDWFDTVDRRTAMLDADLGRLAMEAMENAAQLRGSRT